MQNIRAEKPASQRKPIRLALTGALLAGAVLCFAEGASIAQDTEAFAARAIRAEGHVIALPFGRFHPLIEFTDTAGNRQRFQQAQWAPSYRQGDAVPVLYDPNAQPLEASVNSAIGLYGLPIGLAGTGCFSLLLSVCAYLGLVTLNYSPPRRNRQATGPSASL